jgi:hypothetical protein
VREARDDVLGTALRELEVPDHAQHFYAELHYRLAEQRAVRERADHRRLRARRGRIRWGVRVALAAAVAAIVFVAIGLPRSERTGPGVATAAEVKATVAAALARVDNLRGRVLLVSHDPLVGDEETSWRFAMTADGDFRLTESGRPPGDLAYESSTGTERSISTSASIQDDETVFYAENRGLAPGPPDPGPSEWVLARQLGSVVRALLANRDPRVSEVEHRGRAAWQLAIDVEPNRIVPEFSGDHFDVVVDRQTGIPVQFVEKKNGKVLSELVIEDLVVDGELPPDAFRIDFPPGAEILRTDAWFRRVELAEVESAVGYAPLVPARVPEGFELAEVAVATRGTPTGSEAANPRSEMVVSLSYRRGLDELLVTTRLARPPHGLAPSEPQRPLDELWSDPLATGEGFVDKPEQVTLDEGALAGVQAELLIVPRNIPHLWALTDELVVTVSGDVTRADLLAAAQSLERR